MTRTTDTTRPPRRDPKDTVLQALYFVLFAMAGVTCLTGILFLRSGLRIAQPATSAASTTSVVREPALLAPPAAASEDSRRLPVVRRVTRPEGPDSTDADVLSIDPREPRMRTSGKTSRR